MSEKQTKCVNIGQVNLGKSYQNTGSNTSLCTAATDRQRGDSCSESSYCSETSGESESSEKETQIAKKQRRDAPRNGGGSGEEKSDKRDMRQSLSECWTQSGTKWSLPRTPISLEVVKPFFAFLIAALSLLLVFATVPFSLYMCVKVVQEYERAVIFRLGRLVKGGAKGPGIFFIIPCIDTYKKVDLRTVSFDVPPQEVLTRDSVTVTVDAVVYYRVSNPTMATNNVEDYGHSTHLLGATTLRNVLGTKCLADILSEREKIANWMEQTLDEATDPWGVKVERVEIKDVRLPVQLQRAMAAEAEAAREARAKVIAAEGEQKASRALREASSTIAESSAALQLRYLQTLNSISAEKNSTIIFPVPLDIMSQFMRKPTC